jgi:hypothetical protein
MRVEDGVGNAGTNNITVHDPTGTTLLATINQNGAGVEFYVNQNATAWVARVPNVAGGGGSSGVPTNAPVFSTWREIRGTVQDSIAVAGTVTGQYVLPTASSTGNPTPQVYTGTVGAAMAFKFVNADYPNGPSGGTPQIRIRGWVKTNAVAQTGTFTFALYPVATWGGASGVNPEIASLGAAVVSTAVAAPAAGGPTDNVSASANIPATGWYVVTCTISGANVAANGPVYLGFRVSVQQP